MVINKIRIIHENSEWSEDFVDGVNIINANDNQLGKSTIIKSILFALGAKENVFEGSKIEPEIVEMVVDGKNIKRSKKIWSIDGKIVNNGREVAELLGVQMPRIRIQAGNFNDAKIINVMAMNTLIQKREDKAKDSFWDEMQKNQKNDLKMTLAGFDRLEELVSESEKKSKIEKTNKKISKNIKLNEYILNDKVEEIKDFEDYDKKLIILKKEVRKTYIEQRKSEGVINDFIEQSEYVDAINSFVGELVSIDGLSEASIKEEIEKRVKRRFQIDDLNTISVFELENAKMTIETVKSEREKLYKEITDLESKALESAQRPEIINKVISYALAKQTTDDIKSTVELTKKISEIKAEREEFSDKIKTLKVNRMRALGIKKATEGLGQVSEYIIERIYWKPKVSVPLLIDSADEVATKEKFLNYIINPSLDYKGQVIFTTLRKEFDQEIKSKLNIINIDTEIFGK